MGLDNFHQKYKTTKIVLTMLQHAIDSPEHPIYHPEGTLIAHIDIVVDRAMERPEAELHFAAIMHDITKHGICPELWEGKKGHLKEIPTGTYWQNIYHDKQAVDFINLPEVYAWVSGYCDVEIVKIICRNHMRMKNYISGEKGNVNGMKESKRLALKESLGDVFELAYHFSTYCDNMLYGK